MMQEGVLFYYLPPLMTYVTRWRRLQKWRVLTDRNIFRHLSHIYTRSPDGHRARILEAYPQTPSLSYSLLSKTHSIPLEPSSGAKSTQLCPCVELARDLS